MASIEQSSSPPKIEAASSIHFLYLSCTLTSLISTSPTLVFQLPLRDFLLKFNDHVKLKLQKFSASNSHQGLVCGAELEDVQVTVGLYKLLDGAILIGDSNNTLEVLKRKVVEKIGKFFSPNMKTYLKTCFIFHLDLSQSSVGVADLKHAGESPFPRLIRIILMFYDL